MTGLRDHLHDYVALRRSLGFALHDADWLLPSFLAYLEDRGAAQVSTELAVAWACRPGVAAVTQRQRLVAVRGFAQYVAAFDVATEVPPAELVPGRYVRITPYLYSDEEIEALMAAAAALASPIRAATYSTLIGLLSVSGLRLGEAIRLDDTDVDRRRQLLVVRDSKHERERHVPLHPTTLDALGANTAQRDRRFPTSADASLFVSTLGTRLNRRTVEQVWTRLVTAAGLGGRGARCRPRVHDIRHSFAVNTLIGWHRDGLDVDARMPLLSAALGHVNPASTYWYLQAAPELLDIVARRARPAFEGLA